MKDTTIFQEFLQKTEISEEQIVDYRPCIEFYGVPKIPNAIVMQLKNKGKLIYISEEKEGAAL